MIPQHEIEKPLRDSKGKIRVIDQGESFRIVGNIVMGDEVFNLAAIQTLSLTLYDADTLVIINGRNAQDVLNANGGTVDADGNFIIRILPLDNAIVNPLLLKNMTEKHIAKIHGTFINLDELETFVDEWAIYVRKLAVPVSS